MTQPSGWYDDPADPSGLRYWDGIIWTERTVPKQSPTASASTIGHAVDPYAAAPPSAYPPAYPPGQAPYPPSTPTPYGQPPAGRDYGAAPTYQWRPQGPTTLDGAPLAQWWQRLLAAMIDGVVVGLAGALMAFPWWRDFLTWYVAFLQKSMSGAADPALATLMTEISTEMARFIVPITLIQAGVAFVYHVAFLTRNGASLGKMALGIRVRRVGRPGPSASWTLLVGRPCNWSSPCSVWSRSSGRSPGWSVIWTRPGSCGTNGVSVCTTRSPTRWWSRSHPVADAGTRHTRGAASRSSRELSPLRWGSGRGGSADPRGSGR